MKTLLCNTLGALTICWQSLHAKAENAQRYHMMLAGQHMTCAICIGQAKKLSSSFTLNSDESVVLQKLSLNMHTLRLKKNSLLFLLSTDLARAAGMIYTLQVMQYNAAWCTWL